MSSEGARSVRGRAYGVLFLLFAGIILLSHAAWLDLPYFWDEAGYYIPAALDFLHGSPIPHSVSPGIHPPAVSAYLAAVWSLAGFHPESTRCAMLLVAACALLLTLLLAIELLRDAPGMPGFLAAAFLCLSPVFFAQSLLAQLDMPAMLLSTLALWLFLRERIVWAAIACVALVLTKETGCVAPLVLGVWLGRERRWKEAAWFLVPLAVLVLWVAAVHHATGRWAGNADFLQYNLFYPLHPLRLAAAVLRRIYYLLFANLHWIGAFAILFAWRVSRLFHGRSWRVAGAFAAAHVAAVTLLGGATLERYLLPAMPILYTAMAAGLACFPRRPRLICSAALLAGLAAGIFLNPPYPFPFEDNMAMADFTSLQTSAADFLKHCCSNARIETAWPLSVELQRPSLGYVGQPLSVDTLPALTRQAIQDIDWERAQAVAVFATTWDPPLSPLRWAPVRSFWNGVFGYEPPAAEEDLRRAAPYPPAARWSRNGQWMDIYVNPLFRTVTPARPLRANR
jgi:hypothetical protein